MNSWQSFQSQLIEFLIDIPALQVEDGRRAMSHRAALDDKLIGLIDFKGATHSFITLFIEILVDYRTLNDGRDALEEFLIAIKPTVGEDRKTILDALIAHWRQIRPTINHRVEKLSVYLYHLIRTWERLSSPLLPSNISLSRIAVRLKVVDVNTQFEVFNKPKIPGYHRKTREDYITKSAELDEYLQADPVNRRWIILGDPGSGKSTLIMFEAARLAKLALENTSDPIPVSIQLAHFAQQVSKNLAYSIYNYLDDLGQSLAIISLGQEIHRYVTQGRVIFLLDGLDEVQGIRLDTLIEQIDSSVPSKTGNRLIFTSRKTGYSNAGEKFHLEIEPLGVNEQRQLMLAICGEHQTAILLRNIAGRSDLQDLASVPITLTVLALIAREARDDLNSYLRRRTDLYRSGIQLLLEGRQRNYSGVANPEQAERVLAHLSYELHAQVEHVYDADTFAVQSIEEVIRKVDQKWLSSWRGVRHFIKDVTERSSIIYPVDALGRYYRYLHRTFREFLAALYLSYLSQEERHELVKTFLKDTDWAEVLVLLAGLTPDVEKHLNQLLVGSSNLALRALKEIKSLDPKVAIEILQLETTDLRDRRQIFVQLSQKLSSPDLVVDVLRAYLESLQSKIPRADLYFIQEILLDYVTDYNLSIAKDMLENLFSYLPDVPALLLKYLEMEQGSLSYWCNVPSGPFMMGAASSDPLKPSWVPELIQVYISDFQIGRVPITNIIYEAFDPSHAAKRDFLDVLPMRELDNHPAVRVSWYEANIFCQWLAQAYPNIRLPTEAEWEKAASWTLSGQKRKFPWGDTWEPNFLNNWEKGPNRTTQVGYYPSGASPNGVLDMAGNVWEWCSDWFEDNPFAHIASDFPFAPWNPKGVEKGSRKIDRGGGWYYDVGQPTTFIRAADYPFDEFSHCGFRLARSVKLEKSWLPLVL